MKTVLWLLLTAMVMAKPMPSPTLQEALTSPLIVVASYSEFRAPSQGVSYFGGLMAHYEVEEVLKGKSPAPSLWVHYSFHDGSPCIAPPDFRFTPEMMPKKGSRWLLFLRGNGKEWHTYRGDWGRQEADKAAEVRKLLP